MLGRSRRSFDFGLQVVHVPLCNNSEGILLLAKQITDIAQPEKESDFVSNIVANTDCNVRVDNVLMIRG